MELKRVAAGAGAIALLVAAAIIAGGMWQASAQATSQAPSARQGVTSAQSHASAGGLARYQRAAPPLGGLVMAQQSSAPTQTPEPPQAAGQDGDNIQSGDQSSPDTGQTTEAENGGQETSASEAADAQALASQAKITQQQAEQTALAANTGTTVIHSSLGDENGTVVYDVELSNGSDVKVDAQSGAIIGTDKAGTDGAENEGSEGDTGP